MTFKPFPYQLEGAKWLASRKCAYLADEMGLGKTCQAIMAADMIKAKRILVICPAVGRFNWLNEFSSISQVKRTFEISIKSSDFWDSDKSIITSYEGASSVFDEGGKFDLLIIDEAHYLKEPESTRTSKILGSKGLVRISDRVWALSGTPAPNNYSELWPIAYTFGATKLSHLEYISYFCETRRTAYGVQIVGIFKNRIPEIKQMINKIMKRRMKSEVLKDLPPLFFSNSVVEAGKIEALSPNGVLIDFLNSENLRAKLENERKLIEEILENELEKNELKALEAVANSTTTLRRYTGLQKVYEIANLVHLELDLRAYKKIIIFAIHRDVIEGMVAKLKDFNPTFIYGGMTAKQQQDAVEKFQKDDSCRVIVCNIKSAGLSITLTAATQVAFVEMSWNPAENAQAVMRAHRIGQKDSVFVRIFSLNSFIDRRVNDVLLRKSQDLAIIF